MSLNAGTRLGPYEIADQLGAGGMGEVYRATDTRLDRAVAIKVLPEHLSDDPERQERFEREARAVSSLNHPHICTLHDVGEQDGIHYLVMEYVEGETLQHRLEKGRLPVDQALEYAIQIADALDKAHRQGVVHRDLKPGNIMLTKSGTKLLDFGLAKLRPVPDHPKSLSQAPTESGTPHAAGPQVAGEEPAWWLYSEQKSTLTAEGTILGTLQYMAPEQLEGKEADARTDIFAFGAVVYEMVTGTKAFTGKSQVSLITAIMGSEPPPIADVQPVSPPVLGRTVKRCMEKDPDNRWQSSSDLLFQLKWTLDAQPASFPEAHAAALRWKAFPVALGATVLATLVASIVFWNLNSAPTTVVTRLTLELQPGQHLWGGHAFEPMYFGMQRPSRKAIALSPDGRTLVYSAANADGNSQVYLRELDRPEPRPIPSTEEGASPFFSPDGQWVGFWAEGQLQKVSIQGGLPVPLAATPLPYGVSWGPDETIVYSHRGGGIWRVSANGGDPEQLAAPDPQKGETAHLLPEILPTGSAVLFTVLLARNWEDAQIVALSLRNGERKILVDGGAADARYSPSGHLLYRRGNSVVATPFDVEGLEITGAPVPVIDGVMHSTNAGNPVLETGVSHYDLSASGSLVFVPGEGYPEMSTSLVWVDRQGAVEVIPTPQGGYRGLRLSPDGRFAAAADAEHIFVFDLQRNTARQLTFEGENTYPVWSPDGQRLAFASSTAGGRSLSWMSVDGSDTAELLTTADLVQRPTSWSGDGTLAFVEANDIWYLQMDGASEPQRFIETPFSEGWPAFSPDGKWLAYASNETGQYEVYVRPFPGPGSKFLVSTSGGNSPAWAPDGTELFYRTFMARGFRRGLDDEMMVVDIRTNPDFSVGVPRLLFEIHTFHGTIPSRTYDVALDGRRFLMPQFDEPEPQPVTKLRVVLNWSEELKEQVPVP